MSDGKGDAAKVIDLLLAMLYAAYCALDDSEQIEGDAHIIDAANAKAICNLLDAFDELPDDQPGYTMGPAAKARWALRSLIGTGEAAVLAAQEQGLSEAAKRVIAEKFSTYKARNGREVGIQDDSGEMCWIVGHEAIGELEAAIDALSSGGQ